jgi:hypothetical protein
VNRAFVFDPHTSLPEPAVRAITDLLRDGDPRAVAAAAAAVAHGNASPEDASRRSCERRPASASTKWLR